MSAGVTTDQLRTLALALPEAVEVDHHGMASFRIRGKVFATVPAPGRVRVMIEEGEIRALVAGGPEVFSEVWWGKRLACVAVKLDGVDGVELAELLADAWRRKAPTSLARTLPPADQR